MFTTSWWTTYQKMPARQELCVHQIAVLWAPLSVFLPLRTILVIGVRFLVCSHKFLSRNKESQFSIIFYLILSFLVSSFMTMHILSHYPFFDLHNIKSPTSAWYLNATSSTLRYFQKLNCLSMSSLYKSRLSYFIKPTDYFMLWINFTFHLA